MRLVTRAAALRVTIVVAVVGIFCGISETRVAYTAGLQAPRFEVDPMWPKPLPHHWILGNVTGVAVDSHDHIWIVHRQNSLEPMEPDGL